MIRYTFYATLFFTVAVTSGGLVLVEPELWVVTKCIMLGCGFVSLAFGGWCLRAGWRALGRP